MDRMEADGITIVERNDEADYTAFKCLDPDGHRIEVYWEPSPVSSGGCSMTSPPASSNRLSHVGHSIGSGTAKLDGRPTALRLVPSYGHTTKFTHCRIRRTAIMWSLPGVPCVILYLTLQRYYVQGLTSGAVKG
jgi:hypothetical protein